MSEPMPVDAMFHLPGKAQETMNQSRWIAGCNPAGCHPDCCGVGIQNRMEEYRREVLNGDASVPDDEEIARRLKENCEWTDNSAQELHRLAKYYGAFMLRNALALAMVLDIEDGDGGF